MAVDPKDASSKLDRLLQTEDALEAMLKDARHEAESLVETARAAAADRVHRFESQLGAESAQLRERIERERDLTIHSIQEEAHREVRRLGEVEDAEITRVARHVVELLLSEPGSRGPR